MGKVLIVATNHDSLKQTPETTGLWFSELTNFYDKLKNRHYMTVISPKGGNIPIDHRSLTGLFKSHKLRKYYRAPGFRRLLRESLSPKDVKAADYDAIYFTGGHGTLWDFPESKELQQLTREIYENGGVVAAVCHGPAALLNVKLSDGSYFIQNKTVTGYSDREEKASLNKHEIPYSLEEQLKNRALTYNKAKMPFKGHVEVDDRVITGQNPASVKGVAKAVINRLEQKAFAEHPDSFRAVLRISEEDQILRRKPAP
ncbi:type 1 glutamine amidotransferase domain-containing protein [Terribacillus sp. DMT04]|uniref:type 1 glutamine amidotransferase domain-containing protein n=1 Tax=Terribacillus sp. DMT04 TaxID=2850441 RepID=UPI001C2BA8A1|nr:type 1 glutamine amidotransferase domain-containing protein [Terribacillus sp. DMT04]QXE02633.1 type 1 glutamine amidotransferase domain-containing protein [Terribacillus sp. DMT04]